MFDVNATAYVGNPFLLTNLRRESEETLWTDPASLDNVLSVLSVFELAPFTINGWSFYFPFLGAIGFGADRSFQPNTLGPSQGTGLPAALAPSEEEALRQAGQLRDWTNRIIGGATERFPGQDVTSFARDAVEDTADGAGRYHLSRLLATLQRTPPGGMLLAEEPEIHLAPLAVARLAAHLARQTTAEDLQALISTHSRTLVASLVAQAAHGALPAADLVFYYLEPRPGGSTAERITIEPGTGLPARLSDYLQAPYQLLAF